MSDFLFDPRSTFLNGLFLGDDVGIQSVSPELRQVIATNQTRDAVHDLAKIQLASLYGQGESLALQRQSNEQLTDLNTGIQQFGDRVSSGFGDLSRGVEVVGSQIGQLADGVQTGFGQLSEGMGQLADGMQVGFDHIGVGLQTGFQSVVKGLYHVDERLGQRMLVGFSSLGRQQQRQHGQVIGTLVQGFGFLGDVIDRAAGQTVNAIERAAETQIVATARAADQITMAVVESGRLQAEAIVAMHRQMAQQLGQISDLISNADAVRAVEHFVVGMNFLNNADTRRAQDQFRKAMGIYAGHFPTLFAYGFSCRVQNDLGAAQEAFQAALSQAGGDPVRAARQRSLAALYLGRIAFDRQEYDQARRWFHQAYRQNERLWNALVEGAASLLLDSSRTNRQADAAAVKSELNSFGSQAYLYWYFLALVLAPLARGLAIECFRHGAHGDYRAKASDRVSLIALLWRLNPRTAATLLDLVVSEFTWLG